MTDYVSSKLIIMVKEIYTVGTQKYPVPHVTIR